MAKKKKENTLSYMQMPLPEGRKYSKMTKVAFGGLNKRYTVDSGALTMENNISTQEYPYLTPSPYHINSNLLGAVETPISIAAFDDFVLVVYKEGDSIKISYNTIKKKGGSDTIVHYTGVLKASGVTEEDMMPRSIVQFNVYDTPTDPVGGKYIKKLLIFPDKCSMFMNIVDAESNPLTWEEEWENAAEDKKAETALMKADLDVMYCYEVDSIKYYYTVILVEDTEDGDKDKVTYKRAVQKKYEYERADENNETETVTAENAFFCDNMDVLIKSYTNDKEPYLPPDTASHNYYYQNTSAKAKEADTLYGAAIYKWVDDESDKDNSGWKISIPPTMPDIKYATVHLSRVFGVDDDRVYASGFNDYSNWNLDTIDEYNETNAWCSPSQSNTKASGKFTGITTYQNHVVCFKQDFMHEIYNTKNPFRLQDIYAEGAIDNRTIQDVDGKLIFVSEDDVKIYTGSNPRIIGYNLNMPKYTYAVSGTDNRNYYLYCEDADGYPYLYVYDTYTELWSERSIEQRVLSFAHCKLGMFMLCEDGVTYLLPDGTDIRHYSKQPWSFETDLITNKTVDIKHIKKLQMLVESQGTIKVYILYDDEEFDESTSHLVYSSEKVGKYPIRVKPRKTANYGFNLHIEGTGYVKLYELEIFVEAGGDLYV